MEIARTTGQQLQKYNPHVPRPTAAKVVLPEDVYVDQLDRIIRRDFFPDLVADTDDSNVVTPPMTISRFIANHTSEDNASFHDIVDRAQADLRSRTSWIDARADDIRRADALRSRLQLSSPDDDDPRPKHLDLLRYEPRNTLMFVADNDRAAVVVDRGDRIRHGNTRLTYDGASNLSEMSATTASTSDASMTPCFRGYKLVRSPDAADRRRHLPMDDDERRSGPGLFRVPDLPVRDRLGRRLGQAAAKQLAKRQRDQTPTTTTPLAVEMSPAARRLLTKRQRATGADHQLRASYTTPSMTPTMLTPSTRSMTPLTGRRTR